MNREPDIVSRGEKDETECLSLSTPYGSPLTPRTIAQDNGIGLAEILQGERSCRHMTRNQWLLLGAILLGLAVGLYFLFFCPTDCH